MRLGTLLAGSLILIGGCSALSSIQHFDRDTLNVKITGSERVVESDGDGGSTSKYVVYTKDVNSGVERAFENTDSTIECFFSGCKWNSSDVHAKLANAEKNNLTCQIEVYGWRWGFASWYENIATVDCKAAVEDVMGGE